MTRAIPYTITRGSTLTDAELGAVLALRAVCDAAEGLDLKLAIPEEGVDEQQQLRGRSQLLARQEDGAIIGYCSLDFGHETEICGMVQPTQRRRGIGSALLAAALDECRLIGVSRALLICEDASASGQSFVARHAGTRAFGEYRMERDAPSAPLAEQWPAADTLRIERAGPADVEDIVTVQAGAFHDSADEVRDVVLAGLAGAGERFYIARLGGEPVGSLKVYIPEGRAGIYAFGVAPRHRRRGFGRQILLRVMAELSAEGHTRIWLEVDQDNAPAYALYRALAFTVTTAYGYFTLPL